jgi:hypothetical protein
MVLSEAYAFLSGVLLTLAVVLWIYFRRQS